MKTLKRGFVMRLLLIPVIILGFIASANNIAAQEQLMQDPIVIAAYEKTMTPSGLDYRDKIFGDSGKKWFAGDLEVANIVFASSPTKESSFSWRGRREGFLGNYAKAIEIFTNGMELFPDSYRLYRYRGYFLVRNYQFEEGIADLRHAEELIADVDVSPVQDGIPGKSNFSPSTFKRNIFYYLGQSSMANGDYATVIEYMDKAVETNQLRDEDDFLVATTFYKYMALRKMGRSVEAQELVNDIPNGLDIIENHTYHEAIRYLQGRYSRAQFIKRADSLGKYTLGMVDHFNEKNDDAIAFWQEVSANNHKGYWLAEVELSNMGGQ